jgi:O-antigen biosynthesis protein
MSDSRAKYFQYARPEVAELVPADVNRVLDIGCAAGFLGAGLKERGVREVWGIELDEAAATAARERLDQVLLGDVYELGKTLEDGFFDAVVMADVLEHLVHTEAALALARRILTPQGKLVLSLPNMRHWSTVRMLLEGDWAYQDAGIMDRTHLRFFTLRSAMITLRAAGFTVEHAAGINLSPPPAGFADELEAVMGKLLWRTKGLAEELAMYQILFVCSKTPEE